MWATDGEVLLPHTRQLNYLISYNGQTIFMKPGKGYYWNQGWTQLEYLKPLNKKIAHVVKSPSGVFSIHIPSLTPVLTFHDNRLKSILVSIPFPNYYTPQNKTITMFNSSLPNGDQSQIGIPYGCTESPNPYSLKMPCTTVFSNNVKGLSISDSGKIFAFILDSEFWIWRQCREYVRGVGSWLNIADDPRFVLPEVPRDGATEPHQYRNIFCFDNPDEGPGVCFLCAFLPPSRPYDTITLSMTVVTFRCDYPVIKRYGINIEASDGPHKPLLSMDPCGRVLLIAFNAKITILTRQLDVINIIPLGEIFAGNTPYVSGAAWAPNCQFCVLTSATGKIGTVTRSGVNLRHSICELQPFNEAYGGPLYVVPDTKDPSNFIIHSDASGRRLRFNMDAIPQNLQTLISLPFPMKNLESLYDAAVYQIRLARSEYDVIHMLHLCELYHVFEYQGSLRHIILKSLDRASVEIFKQRRDLFSYFLARAIFIVTHHPTPVYYKILELMQYSKNPRDQLMRRILADELDRCDWREEPVTKNPRINYVNPSAEIIPPNMMKDADVAVAIQYIHDLLYNPDFNEIEEVNVDLAMMFEVMIQIGRFDRAMVVAQHESIMSDPISVFKRIVQIHKNDPIALFRAMEICCTVAPADEPEIRSFVVHACNEMLKERVIKSAPTPENPKLKLMSDLCIIEDSVDIPVPENIEQCDDFAVLAGIALAAADFNNVTNFLNGKSHLIASSVKSEIRDLFQILWFVKWRFAAMHEAEKTGQPGNATLRLLAFPEFINVDACREQIQQIEPDQFDPEVYSAYMERKISFEFDPVFIDYAIECDARIQPRTLARISQALLSFATPISEIPESMILVATIASHAIPWLRIGIPRAMSGYDSREFVFHRLLDFEEFSFPEKPKPELKITEPVKEFPVNDEKEQPVNFEIQPADPLPDSSPVHIDPAPEPVLDIPDQPSEGEEIPKKHKHRHRQKQEEEVHVQMSREPWRPKIKLMQIDRHRPMYSPLPGPCMGVMMPTPLMQPQPTPVAFVGQPAGCQPYPLGPIWDVDPMVYQRPFPRPPPNIPRCSNDDIPVKVSTETQAQPNYASVPTVVLKPGAGNKSHRPREDDSDTDEFEEVPRIQMTRVDPVDPFPLDTGLDKRVEALLNDPIAYRVPHLPPKPN